MELIDKTVLEAEIFAKIKKYATFDAGGNEKLEAVYGAVSKTLMDILRFMNTLDVISPDGEKIERSNFKDEDIAEVLSKLPHIDKSAVVAEIYRLNKYYHMSKSAEGEAFIKGLLVFLENPYDDVSIKVGIEKDIKSDLFN